MLFRSCLSSTRCWVSSCAELDRNPDLEGATCRRTLCPNGTVLESVEFTTRNDDRELTQEELDKWVASFPVETQ